MMNVVYISVGIVFVLMMAGRLHGRERARKRVIRVVESHCTGCRRCIKRCSHHVLEMVKDETGMQHAVVKNPDKCTACGDCLGRCKFNALELVERVNMRRNE
ncbi:MAG: ferredoxin family protein [Tannerellaceae bacterium]|jgi:NAD-dependent dihydropyrimidine dehydrogenase PreA subunit|nr:ferredoxin family protein [Tannerellaceae bacterium]